MKTEWLYKTFSLAIIVILFYMFYSVLKPFLITIAWAMVLSITFYPMYRLFLRFLKQPWAASLLTLLIILILIIGPFSYIVGTLATDITHMYRSLEEKGFETLAKIKDHPLIAEYVDKMSSYKILEGFDLQTSAVNTLKSIGKGIAQHTKDIFKNAILLIINFILMCITIFYFLKDGNSLANFIKRLLPFSEQQKDKLEERVKEMVAPALIS